MSNQTSSVKIYEERNTTYGLGQELRFYIPPNVLMMNTQETYLKFNLRVSTNLFNQYALNHQIGAEALIKELSIFSGDEDCCIEQIRGYNRLCRNLAYYNHNSSMDNFAQVFRGGQKSSPVKSSNVLYNKDANGNVTQKTIEVVFPLSLSGVFSSSQPFPVFLTKGLIVKILLEDDVYKVCNRMSQSQSVYNKLHRENNKYLNRPTGTAVGLQYECFDVVPNSNSTSIDLRIPTDAIQNGNYHLPEPSGTASIVNNPFSVGGKFTICKSDQSSPVEVEITAISLNLTRLRLTYGALNVFGSAESNCKVFATSQKSEMELSDVEIVVGTITPNQKVLSGIESAVRSKGGYGLDMTSWLDYPVNIDSGALQSSIFIPAKLARAKTILSMWEDVGNAGDGSRDDLLSILDTATTTTNNDDASATNPKEYVFQLNNLLVPNRKVEMSKLANGTTTTGGWEPVHLKELEQGIESGGYAVRNLLEPQQACIIARNLARYGHTYNMLMSKGETRLNIDWNAQTRNLLVHNYICHLRRLVVNANQKVVVM